MNPQLYGMCKNVTDKTQVTPCDQQAFRHAKRVLSSFCHVTRMPGHLFSEELFNTHLQSVSHVQKYVTERKQTLLQ